MTRCIQAHISVGLFNELRQEKKRLQEKERKKRNRKRKKVTYWHASQSLLNKVR